MGTWRDRGSGMPVTCEGSRGILLAPVVIPLSTASSPRSKLLLCTPGSGGGDGGGCQSPALSLAASGRGDAEAGASKSGASLPAADWRPGAPLASLALAFLPYRAAASSSPVLRHLRLQGSGMPLSLGSRRRGPRLLCSSASPSPPRPSQRVPKERGRVGKAVISSPVMPGLLGDRGPRGVGGRAFREPGRRASDPRVPTARNPARRAARGLLRVLRRSRVGLEAAPTSLLPGSDAAGLCRRRGPHPHPS